MHANGFGQFSYCAPEQINGLKNSSKRSDVYSLGKVINFIMTKDSEDVHHDFGRICSKATNREPNYRYRNAGELLHDFEKVIESTRKENWKKEINKRINNGILDSEVEDYLHSLSAERISKCISNSPVTFVKILIKYMLLSEDNAQFVIQGIESTYIDECRGSFDAFDPFATVAYEVIKGRFSFTVKSTAASILYYVAWNVNRFSAQDRVKDLCTWGVDPLIEDIIKQ
ncbi:MAG: hypothetical protein IKH28_05370 [Lachnospiraceae bacterium]|nr:hypothetical protein [Lachnospiraceae bacterium]